MPKLKVEEKLYRKLRHRMSSLREKGIASQKFNQTNLPHFLQRKIIDRKNRNLELKKLKI